MVIINKKGQLTLFIVIGILVFVALAVFFVIYRPDVGFFGGVSSPVDDLSSCIDRSIRTSEKNFFDNNELINQSSIYYMYAGQSMPFLCYSSEFYYPCIPQSPLFIESIRLNMENKVSRDLSRCVLAIKEDYERKGYLFDYASHDLSLVFNEIDISYEAKLDISVSKGEESIAISTLNGIFPTILPKLLRTAETIVNYESVFCEFNYMTWQAINRNVEINRDRGGDQTKVYSLGERDSDREIKFAIRTCVLPAGI